MTRRRMPLVFMAPAIYCYCQVITSLVDQVSRNLNWWIFSDKIIVGPHGPGREPVTKLDVDVDVGTRVLAMLAAFCVSGPCLTLLIR